VCGVERGRCMDGWRVAKEGRREGGREGGQEGGREVTVSGRWGGCR